jgi:hypothetical protein
MLTVPRSIVAGDRQVWRHRDLRGTDPVTGSPVTLDPAIYSLTWTIAGETTVNVSAGNDGGEYVTIFDAPAVKGNYFYQAYVSRSGARLTLSSGPIEVVENLAVVATPFDGRSQLEKDLESIEAAIRVVVAGGVQSYSIQGRSLSKLSLGELIALRDKYKADLQSQRAAEAVRRGEGDPRRSFVRFR